MPTRGTRATFTGPVAPRAPPARGALGRTGAQAVLPGRLGGGRSPDAKGQGLAWGKGGDLVASGAWGPVKVLGPTRDQEKLVSANRPRDVPDPETSGRDSGRRKEGRRGEYP